MKRYGYWLIAGLLCLGAVAHAQEQKAEDYVQAAIADLQQKTGKAPQPQEIVDALSNRVVEIYQKGDYPTSIAVAEQTYRFAEQKLGPEHPDTLTSVNNLAGLYQVQGRYGEAEPLYRRALAASEKVLGPEHPNTLASVNNLAGFISSPRAVRGSGTAVSAGAGGEREGARPRTPEYPGQRQQPRGFI